MENRRNPTVCACSSVYGGRQTRSETYSARGQVGGRCRRWNNGSDQISEAQEKNLNEFVLTATTEAATVCRRLADQCRPSRTLAASDGSLQRVSVIRSKSCLNAGSDNKKTQEGPTLKTLEPVTRQLLTGPTHNPAQTWKCCSSRSRSCVQQTASVSRQQTRCARSVESCRQTINTTANTNCSRQMSSRAVGTDQKVTETKTSHGQSVLKQLEGKTKPCAAVPAVPKLAQPFRYTRNARVCVVPKPEQNEAPFDHCLSENEHAGRKYTTQNVLPIGTSVRIIAAPDLISKRCSRDSFLTAVVLYVTEDSRYKLGTRQGILGQLFSRDQLHPINKRLLETKDVPMKTVNLREASLFSY